MQFLNRASQITRLGSSLVRYTQIFCKGVFPMSYKSFIYSTAIGLAALATSAQAQSLCGGIGENGQWIGGSLSASDVALFSDYQEQMALVLGGNQYVSLFSTSVPIELRLEAAARGVGDTVIDLYDEVGNLVTSDDDSGGSGASRIETSVVAGTYCLAMRSYDNAPMTAFVRIGRTEHEALTEGVASTPDTPAIAPGGGSCTDPATPELVLGTSGTGSVADVPNWRFVLDQDMPVTVTATNPSADPYVTVYDEFGTYIGENDDFDGLNSRLDLSSPLSAGTYCIAMQALSDGTAPITVTVSAFDPAAAMAAMFDRGEAAPPMDGSYPITALGDLASRLRIDAQNTTKATWFSLNVPEGGLMLIEAIAAGGNGDPIVYLYDDLGRLIEMNDDYGSGFDSQITAKVNPGEYMIALREINDGSQGFVRLLIERYVPAQ